LKSDMLQSCVQELTATVPDHRTSRKCPQRVILKGTELSAMLLTCH
jgi:hypothetical protein